MRAITQSEARRQRLSYTELVEDGELITTETGRTYVVQAVLDAEPIEPVSPCLYLAVLACSIVLTGLGLSLLPELAADLLRVPVAGLVLLGVETWRCV